MRKDEKFYKRISIKGETVMLHRYVMECHLCRSLSSDEIVHHINGDTLDNRISNLRLLTASEHSRIEHLGKKQSERTRQKRSRSLIGNQNALDSVRSKDFIENLKQKRTGTRQSPETCAKISQSLIGNSNNLGQKRSAETRRKISEANYRRWAKVRKVEDDLL